MKYMKPTFRIEMLPAEYGDCLWIEYGTENKIHRILVDGGTTATYDFLSARLLKMPVKERRFELLIITHVDADHIDGAVRLLQDKALQVVFKEVWFNGWKHLSDLLCPVAGEYLSALLEEGKYNWNTSFDEAATVLPDSGIPPTINLTGGLELTLISPTKVLLDELRNKWEEVVRDAKLLPGNCQQALKKLESTKRFKPNAKLLGRPEIDVTTLLAERFRADNAVANGSSIAVLMRCAGKSCLLAADAYPSVIVDSLRKLPEYSINRKIKLDAFKLPHHGSKANISVEMLQAVDCSKYLFSTNGNRFKHPSLAGVARVIKYGGRNITLCFNYRTDFTECWENEKLMAEHKYRSLFPKDNRHGLSIGI